MHAHGLACIFGICFIACIFGATGCWRVAAWRADCARRGIRRQHRPCRSFAATAIKPPPTGRSPPPSVLAWRHKVSVSFPLPPRCRRTWRSRHHVPLVSPLPIAGPSSSRQRPTEHMTHMQLWAVLLYVHRTVCHDHCIVRVWPVCMFSVLSGPLSVLFVAFSISWFVRLSLSWSRSDRSLARGWRAAELNGAAGMCGCRVAERGRAAAEWRCGACGCRMALRGRAACQTAC